MDGLKRYVNDDRFRVNGDKNMRLLAFAFTIVFVWTGPKVSKYGKSEYSRAWSASCTFQPLMSFWYTAISRKVVGKRVHATAPKGNMGYDQYTVSDSVAVEPTFAASL